MSNVRSTSQRQQAQRDALVETPTTTESLSAVTNRELLRLALTTLNRAEAEALFTRAVPFIQELAVKHMRFHFPIIQGFDRDAIVQDTVIRVWQGRDTFNPSREGSTWVSMVTRSCAIDYLRKLNTRRAEATHSLDSLESDVAQACLATSDDYNPATIVEREDTALATQGRIDLFVAQLSPDDQAAFKMQIDQKSYKEMAAALDVPLGTMKTRLFSLRQRLRKHLRSDSE